MVEGATASAQLPVTNKLWRLWKGKYPFNTVAQQQHQHLSQPASYCSSKTKQAWSCASAVSLFFAP